MISKDTTPIPVRRRLRALPLVVLVVAAVVAMTALVALASTPLDVAGYLTHAYTGDHNVNEPTAVTAESKLWWHDGYWWGVLYSVEDNTYNIHRLDTTSQDWIDTGVLVDDRIGDPDSETDSGRRQARADALMDSAAGKLYIVSHRVHDQGRRNTVAENQARLRVYSYNSGSDSWTLDDGFPVSVNQDMTESVVLDKDDDGRLWVSYVSQHTDDSFYVYVNASAPGNAASWGTPFILPIGDAAMVDTDDLSALLAFEDAGGPKVAVMWSNQRAGHDKFYIAVRAAGAGDADDGWTLEESGLDSVLPFDGDDHINMKRAPNGDLLAVVKTDSTTPGEPLVGVVRRAANGTYSFHNVSMYGSQDTRPVMLVDSGNNEVHVYTISKTGGGNVCEHSAPLGTLAFTVDNCAPPPITCEGSAPELGVLGMAVAPVFIGDNDTICNIDNPTTTKQVVNADTGRVVLATDNVDKSYVHNAVDVPGTEPTPTTPVPTPDPDDPYKLYLPLVQN